MKYEIILKNFGGYIMFREIVEAENENKAIYEVIDELDFASGDTLTIEEVED